jgi:hypothetical protein
MQRRRAVGDWRQLYVLVLGQRRRGVRTGRRWSKVAGCLCLPADTMIRSGMATGSGSALSLTTTYRCYSKQNVQSPTTFNTAFAPSFQQVNTVLHVISIHQPLRSCPWFQWYVVSFFTMFHQYVVSFFTMDQDLLCHSQPLVF